MAKLFQSAWESACLSLVDPYFFLLAHKWCEVGHKAIFFFTAQMNCFGKYLSKTTLFGYPGIYKQKKKQQLYFQIFCVLFNILTWWMLDPVIEQMGSLTKKF